MFSVTVLHDDRIVLVAEQRPDASEEDSFQWMSRVLQVGTRHSLWLGDSPKLAPPLLSKRQVLGLFRPVLLASSLFICIFHRKLTNYSCLCLWGMK